MVVENISGDQSPPPPQSRFAEKEFPIGGRCCTGFLGAAIILAAIAALAYFIFKHL